MEIMDQSGEHVSSEQIAEYLDGCLNQNERKMVEVHIADCRDCQEILVLTFRYNEAHKWRLRNQLRSWWISIRAWV